MSAAAPSILWFRRDLRLTDHPALAAAAADGPVVPVFVLDPALSSLGARVDALHACLRSLSSSMNGALVVRSGSPLTVLPALVAETGARAVHVTDDFAPYGRRRDAAVEAALDVPLVRTGTPYAVPPGAVLNGKDQPYQVFSAYCRAWRSRGWPAPVDPVDVRWVRDVAGEQVPGGALELSPEASLQRWREFLDDSLSAYSTDRDRPDIDGTSRMSVALKFGLVHPRTLLADLGRRARSEHARKLGDELCWREFYADVLFHHPRSAWHDLRDSLGGMEYADPSSPDVARRFAAWREGRTGFPIVDAGMRQLREEGWMHNRVRMITASFLVKDLHIWWPHGARHFLDLLYDGDIASNNHGWQWVAGTGTDAAPYFRVFNPTTQGRKFDPQGDYVRRYVPELRHLSGAAVHEPGDQRGDYPEPIVDHAVERRVALERYQAARAG